MERYPLKMLDGSDDLAGDRRGIVVAGDDLEHLAQPAQRRPDVLLSGPRTRRMPGWNVLDESLEAW